MTHLVFVYGTLKRGFPNHHYMADGEYVGEARTVLAYPMVIGGQWFSPSLIPEPGSGYRIAGELWQVDDALLARLDELETTHLPTGYNRQHAEVQRASDGTVVAAWTYFRPRDRITVIHSEPMPDYQDRRYVPAGLRPR